MHCEEIVPSNVITSISFIWYTTSHLLRFLFFFYFFYYLRHMIKQINTSYIRNTNKTIYNIIITIVVILSYLIHKPTHNR